MAQQIQGALEGRVAVVTGASRGIGDATAKALVARGARVALLARRWLAIGWRPGGVRAA